MNTPVFTFSDLQRLTGITRNSHRVWAREELLRGSVREASGTGTRHLFDWADLCRCRLLVELRQSGFTLEMMREALNYLSDSEWDRTLPAPGARRDRWLLIESLDRIQVVPAATFKEASENRPRVFGLSLSHLLRELRAAVGQARGGK